MQIFIKLIYTILLTINFCLFANFNEKTIDSIKCVPQLRQYLAKIEKIPEARKLITSIQTTGPIQILIDNNQANQFEAYWDPSKRVIAVSYPQHPNEGEIIGSILFELHNASVDHRFKQLFSMVSQRKISKALFIESMEYLEYTNSLNAAKIAEIGIRKGVFPSSAHLPTYSSFKEHFSQQKQSGHSAWFARLYDNLCKET